MRSSLSDREIGHSVDARRVLDSASVIDLATRDDAAITADPLPRELVEPICAAIHRYFSVGQAL